MKPPLVVAALMGQPTAGANAASCSLERSRTAGTRRSQTQVPRRRAFPLFLGLQCACEHAPGGRKLVQSVESHN